MQVVDAFVERNRKEAEDSIDKLTKEAETLRARLQRVEAALERWKAVEDALKREPAKVSEGADHRRLKGVWNARPAKLPEASPQLEPTPSAPQAR